MIVLIELAGLLRSEQIELIRKIAAAIGEHVSVNPGLVAGRRDPLLCVDP